MTDKEASAYIQRKLCEKVCDKEGNYCKGADCAYFCALRRLDAEYWHSPEVKPADDTEVLLTVYSGNDGFKVVVGRWHEGWVTEPVEGFVVAWRPLPRPCTDFTETVEARAGREWR